MLGTSSQLHVNGLLKKLSPKGPQIYFSTDITAFNLSVWVGQPWVKKVMRKIGVLSGSVSGNVQGIFNQQQLVQITAKSEFKSMKIDTQVFPAWALQKQVSRALFIPAFGSATLGKKK